MIVAPGATIGIVGGGQLGRMLAIAAAQLGYRSHILSPEASGPATEVAAAWTRGDYDDWESMRRFGEAVDVVTYEFENVDPHTVAGLAGFVPLRPSCLSLDVSRYRPNEKQCAERMGGATAPWRTVRDPAELAAAVDQLGTPAILKTCMFGYDGKGQARIDRREDADGAWQAIGAPSPQDANSAPAILEKRVDFLAEFSVILCRGADGAIVVWDTPENVHRGGILDTSTLPARPEVLAQASAAVELAKGIAEQLGHIGVLTCEFFATVDGPIFNEMAPRVHNSGHWTIEGAVTSQFENHIRAICGLPLGDAGLVVPKVRMKNLIGEDAARWREILSDPCAHLHLYGKGETRPGRKMGHVTWLG
ncbi:MAG TPA: 5-(carboxyamino)imidazole ribonucleotide synthase [Allosphingosinicella sp.]|jgi:5-(carboxyamino)imidazole ribonucleotide synthase|uniref:5-(carboxyamino)imidazole ribonucleotide synthase n=1 Tax=Allosphingosinicella sp. TaxID=2823234 RepID=UPI002F28C05E